jgi:putative FmdB family regulatory protein
MPLLKYICEDCKQIFEEFSSSDKKPKCPACASGNTKRHYQGKCYFGGGGNAGGGCAGNCSGCKGCSA